MGERSHILIVNVEPPNRDALTRCLVGYDFNVSSVTDDAACLCWLAAGNRCDLILIDMPHPRDAGTATLAAIRATFSPDSLPVIVVSAAIEADEHVTALDAGANDFVVKPINVRVLAARLRAALRLRQTVSALVEAERQRVMVETLGRSATQLGAPLRQMIDQLEHITHRAIADEALQRELAHISHFVEDAIEVIERLKTVSESTDLPFHERLDLLSGE